MSLSETESPTALIEIGVIVAGPLDWVDARAAKLAVEQTDRRLQELFPGFKFNFFEIRRPEMLASGRVEPSLLLCQALEERDALHWDFAFVLTAAELIGNYSTYCFAALSRPLDAAVISLSLIDPLALGVEVNDAERVERIARRLSRLMLHGVGHLSGLPRSDHPNDLLFHPPNARALDHMAALEPADQQRQREALMQIADQRLEEGIGRRMGYVSFVIRAAWINRREIYQAVWAARPWEFPKRLSRLTIASFSTLAILLMTAEAWDLALAQGRNRLLLLVVASLISTTLYVVLRQQLLVRRGTKRSEQTVVTSASALGIVCAGMLTTWATLFVSGLMLSHLLFPSDLIATWAATTIDQPHQLSWLDRPQMATFSASLGIMIGALGASFESQHYFRHIIFVDEEI
ncbi:hypothetical protein NHH03_07775 [Stieleria sp. TO1_6]|uniref:hypothetical protein n=1 Tax=Stieleria tagensis TaxID=2956795 RepID=UPI00209B01CA|nr:hypothetical protein [Stieleria tagensis]MCO8121631.1 hypothetical protein [Stieleria tagensis]